MTSSFTQNLTLEEPANGDYTNTWNVPVNSNFSILDQATGGRATVNVVSASGTVALAATTYRNRIIIFSGALTANVNYQLPSGVGGFWFMYNNTTGAYTVTVSSAGGGTSLVLPQTYTSSVICDGTNVGNSITAPVPLATYATSAGTATSATSAATATNATNLVTTNFSIVQSGSYLYIKYGTTNIARIDSSGNFIALANVTANGSI